MSFFVSSRFPLRHEDVEDVRSNGGKDIWMSQEDAVVDCGRKKGVSKKCGYLDGKRFTFWLGIHFLATTSKIQQDHMQTESYQLF